MENFICNINDIIAKVDSDTLDLIIFPQLSRELDSIDAKELLLDNCIQMANKPSLKQESSLQLKQFMMNILHKNNLWIKNIKNVGFLQCLTDLSANYYSSLD